MVGQTLLVLYKRSVPRITGLYQYISSSLKQESHTQSALFMNVRYANLCTFYLVHLEQVSNDCQKNQFQSSNFDQSGQQKTVNEPIRISCITGITKCNCSRPGNNSVFKVRLILTLLVVD